MSKINKWVEECSKMVIKTIWSFDLEGVVGSKGTSRPRSYWSVSDLGLVSPRRPDQQYCEIKRVKKASNASQSLESAPIMVFRGSCTWTALIWKHLQHGILRQVWRWDEPQETQPRQGGQSTWALTHPALRAFFTRGISSEDKHEWKSQILKTHRERFHVSATTWHSLQELGLQCQVTMRLLCPLGCGHHRRI